MKDLQIELLKAAKAYIQERLHEDLKAGYIRTVYICNTLHVAARSQADTLEASIAVRALRSVIQQKLVYRYNFMLPSLTLYMEERNGVYFSLQEAQENRIIWCDKLIVELADEPWTNPTTLQFP